MPGLDSGLDTGPDQDPFPQQQDDTDTPVRTLYAIRQALMLVLQDLIRSVALPAINAALASLEVPAGTPALTFSDSSVIVGETSPKKEPIICLTPGAFRNDREAGFFNKILVTDIKIKTIQVADNTPEDFTVFFNAIEDVMNDLLCNDATDVLLPIDSETGSRMLPAGLAFHDCYLTDGMPLAYPSDGVDKVTRYQGWLMYHRAEINYGRLRPNALGL